LRDVFATQDEIVERILKTLRLQLGVLQSGVPIASIPHGTDNPEAYDYFLRASAPYFSTTREGAAKAREMEERAIKLDPKFSYAYAGLASSYVMDVDLGYSSNPDRDLQLATALAQKTLNVDDTNPWGYYVLSEVNFAKDDLTEAADDARRGIALDPSGPFGYQRLADALIGIGKPAEGVEAVRKAMRLDPASDFYLIELGWGENAMQKYEAAISALKQHLVHFPTDAWAHMNVAIAYSETNQKELARGEAAEARRINPNISLKKLRPDLWGDQALFARYMSDLREAGFN
jgi:adenylate cyclase